MNTELGPSPATAKTRIRPGHRTQVGIKRKVEGRGEEEDGARPMNTELGHQAQTQPRGG